MKNILSTLLISALLASLGSAFAQPASHEVEIRIPNVLMLRITDGSSNAPATDPAVNFDFQDTTFMDLYLDILNTVGGGQLAPTSVNNFGDVIVFSNRGAWSVTVAATPILFADDFGIGTGGNGVALSDILVVPSGTPGANVSSVSADWTLATTTSIASGVRTVGWRSLGFSGADYRFSVNGDEDQGTYSTTVTYTIAAP